MHCCRHAAPERGGMTFAARSLTTGASSKPHASPVARPEATNFEIRCTDPSTLTLPRNSYRKQNQTLQA